MAKKIDNYILGSVKYLKSIIRKQKAGKVCLVTSSILFKKLNWAIREMNIPFVDIITIPDGEAAKEWEELKKLLKKFIHLNLDRGSIVVALGGGTVGDLVGFACSIYLRGIRYVQVPTTLLAQVDSAHGAKTGINFSGYKNQIGAFYAPLAVVIDPRLIRFLPRESIIDGLGEIIKAGIIKDPTILTLLAKETVDDLPQSKRLGEIIRKTIDVKQYYTNKDFGDRSIRQILNFGHTIGHAMELKNRIGHGRAVIAGMLKELRIAEELGPTPVSVRRNFLNLLNNLGIKIGDKLAIDKKSILRDKKLNHGRLILPVISKEGTAKLLGLSADKIISLL